MAHTQYELEHPERFPYQYRVWVYCSRIAELLNTPDVEMVIGLHDPSPIQAVSEVFDWCCLTHSSSVVIHYGTGFAYVPEVYIDCRYEDGRFFGTRLNGRG